MLGFAGGLVGVGVGAFGLVVYRDQRWVEGEPYVRVSEGAADTVVVVYSRSGNTLIAAKEAARHFDADLYSIDAPDYPRSLEGQMTASEHAQAERVVCEVRGPSLDLSRYRRVVLATPVWWYRPAIPMWAFAGASDFGGRDVFLLMTGNSRFEQVHIDRFDDLVRSRSGKPVGEAFIARGRVAWQISSDELRAEVRRRLGAFGPARHL